MLCQVPDFTRNENLFEQSRVLNQSIEVLKASTREFFRLN